MTREAQALRRVLAVVAGLWLFAVGAQALAFMARTGMLPGAPGWLARLDFTPQYTLIAGLVALATAASWILDGRSDVKDVSGRDGTPADGDV